MRPFGVPERGREKRVQKHGSFRTGAFSFQCDCCTGMIQNPKTDPREIRVILGRGSSKVSNEDRRCPGRDTWKRNRGGFAAGGGWRQGGRCVPEGRDQCGAVPQLEEVCVFRAFATDLGFFRATVPSRVHPELDLAPGPDCTGTGAPGFPVFAPCFA
jgi:hypothetical protein